MANLGINAGAKGVSDELVKVDAQLTMLTNEIVSGTLLNSSVSGGVTLDIGAGTLEANTAAGMFVVGQVSDKATRLGSILPKGEDSKQQIAKKMAQNM